MNLTELKPNLWKQEAIPTEYTAFQLLRHNPIQANIHYLAAPWSVLINTKDKLFQGNPTPVHNGFTICQHISYTNIIPYLKRCGVTTLFTPHALEKDHKDIKILPFPHHAVNGTDPTDKNILCSFIGCLNTHPVRKIIWDTKPNSPNIKMIRRNAWHYEGPNRQKHETEYKETIARSRYSLCPRGTGASTIRFWESLQAGAIPILISNAMRLPQAWDWNHTIIRIPEQDATKWPKIIANITPDNEQSMRQNCIEAYKAFSKKYLVSNIRLYFRRNTKNLPTIL